MNIQDAFIGIIFRKGGKMSRKTLRIIAIVIAAFFVVTTIALAGVPFMFY